MDGRRRPFVDATLGFPGSGTELDVRLLVDSGADRTILAPRDSARAGMDVTALPRVPLTFGPGGSTDARIVEATVGFPARVIPIALTVMDPDTSQTMPSILGRDVLGRLALWLDEPNGRVLLFDSGAARNLVP